MKIYLSILALLVSVTSHAEQFGETSSYDYPVYQATTIKTLRTMQLGEHHVRRYTNYTGDLKQCVIEKNSSQIYIFPTDGQHVRNYDVTLAFFPSDLVDLEKPLKPGFKNQQQLVIQGYKQDWSAEFKNGKLIIEGLIRGEEISRERIEIQTEGSFLDAEKISFQYEFNPGPNSQKNSFECETIPLS